MRGVNASLVVISLAILIFAILFAFKTVQKIELSQKVVVEVAKSDIEKSESLWIDKLANIDYADRLPADQGTASLDLVDPSFRINRVLVLEFGTTDQYQQNCIDTFFAKRQIAHTKDTKNKHQIRLKTKEIQNANEIIEELKKYDIISNLVILEETKPY